MVDILIRPVITEKMTNLGDKLNKYGFIVDKNANKIQIKSAVESMYGVTVRDVRTLVVPAREQSRFTKAGVIRGRKSAYKKAIITLTEGENIDFYSNI